MMKIYRYKDYDDYVAHQTHANKLKIDRIWVTEKTIELIEQANLIIITELEGSTLNDLLFVCEQKEH